MSKRVLSIISILLAFVFIVSVAQPAYSSNEGKMRVWVEFSPGNAARVEKALQGFGAEFHYRFEDLNSFVVTVPEQALAGLSRNPNVVLVEEDAIRYPMSEAVPEAPYGVEMVQALDVWDPDKNGVIDGDVPTGEGITVCIIDSGLYVDHEDFEYVNVIGGYTNIPGETYDTDEFGHGTHVAGTIAAALNNTGVVGVSPGMLSLYIVKVFGDDGLWAYSSTLANAAQICQAEGAKIISMSLGGAQKNKLEERAFNNLYAAGILSIAAAGNEGTSAYNYPASYSSVVSVAAIDSDKVVADFSQFNGQVELAAPGVGVLSTVPILKKVELTVDGESFTASQVEFSADKIGTGELVSGGLCLSTGSWAGKVVLCERGTNSFYEKVMNVQNSGGTAAIIYNNVPGGFLGTLGEGYSSTIPAVSISQEDGLILLEKVGKLATVNIYSLPEPISGYEAWDGTSMATPHVSGVAALIWSADPTKTNVEVRDALTSTAIDLGDPGRDVYYGYGLVQAKAALDYLGGVTPPPPPPPPPPTGLNVTVSTDKTSYTTNTTVKITTIVKDSDNKVVSGASVNVTIKLEGSSVASLNGTTDPTGTATFTYKIKRNATKGTYSVAATASKDGIISPTTTTSFIVN